MAGHHRSICPTKFAVSEETGVESDVNKTSVNLEVDQLPKSDRKISDSATVVSNTLLAGEKEYYYRLLKLLCAAKVE